MPNPYITIEAEAPLDSRWTPELWFAWSRLLATCRLKRACSAESWPAAVVELTPAGFQSIMGKSHGKAAWILASKLAAVADVTFERVGRNREVLERIKPELGASLERACSEHVASLQRAWSERRTRVIVHNYAKYQKLGRRSLSRTSDPPHVPTSPRNYSLPSEESAATPRTRSDPNAWARMFVREPNPPPGGVPAWVAEQLPTIEGEADASFPASDPTPRAWRGKVRSLLWRYWRNGQANGWAWPLPRGPTARSTKAERLKRNAEGALEILREKERGPPIATHHRLHAHV